MSLQSSWVLAHRISLDERLPFLFSLCLRCLQELASEIVCYVRPGHKRRPLVVEVSKVKISMRVLEEAQAGGRKQSFNDRNASSRIHHTFSKRPLEELFWPRVGPVRFVPDIMPNAVTWGTNAGHEQKRVSVESTLTHSCCEFTHAAAGSVMRV